MRKIEQIVTDEDVGRFTKLGSNRYKVAPFSRISERTMASFDNLVLDPYCGEGRGALSKGRHRFRRYDDFRVWHDGNQWCTELQVHQPFIQSQKFNKAVGGVARRLEPLEINPSSEIGSLFDAFGFDREVAFHAKVHQIRVVTSRDIHGVAVVEGPHRDGHEWQIVAVFNRHDITGGESQLLPTGGGMPFFGKVLQPGEAICNEDAAMWHNASDIYPANVDSMGYRDIWILACNRWHHRRYGHEFEEASLRNGRAQWDLDHPDEYKPLTSRQDSAAVPIT
jgi:hypothetical protein